MDVVELVVEAFAAAGEVRVHRRDLFRSGSFVFVVRLSTSADDRRPAPRRTVEVEEGGDATQTKINTAPTNFRVSSVRIFDFEAALKKGFRG